MGVLAIIRGGRDRRRAGGRQALNWRKASMGASDGSLNHSLLDPGGDFPIIISSRPQLAKEVRRVDIAVLLQEIPVAAAAEHQIGVKLAAELGAAFGEDARQIGDSLQFVAKGRDVVSGEDPVADASFLDDQEIIAADCCDEQGAGGRGYASFAEILHEIEKLARLMADSVEKREISGAVVGFIIPVPALVSGHAVIEESEKCVVPEHAGLGRPRGQALQEERRGRD